MEESNQKALSEKELETVSGGAGPLLVDKFVSRRDPMSSVLKESLRCPDCSRSVVPLGKEGVTFCCAPCRVMWRITG